MTEETANAPRPPIGRIISVVVWGVTDRESPVETDIADAILTATANHGLKPVIASGPYYSDGDEQMRLIAALTVERDRMAVALRTIVAADQLRPSEMARTAREALTPARHNA